MVDEPKQFSLRCPSLPYSTWRGALSTLGEWWDKGRDAQVLPAVAGFAEKIVRYGNGEIAVQHEHGWSRAKVSKFRDGSGFRIKYQPRAYDREATQDVPGSHPCMVMFLTNCPVKKIDIKLNT